MQLTEKRFVVIRTTSEEADLPATVRLPTHAVDNAIAWGNVVSLSTQSAWLVRMVDATPPRSQSVPNDYVDCLIDRSIDRSIPASA